MQSGYGGVSEMQQFLVDAGASTLFSIPPPPQGTTPTDIHGNPLIHPHQHPIPPGMPHFSHFQPMPITQQLFQQSHHQFQLFHQPQPQHHHPQEHRRMVQTHHHHHLESGPENSTSPNRMIQPGGGSGGGGHPQQSFLAAMNFKLGVNESSGGGGSREGMNDDEGILQGDDGSESRFHPWQREEESAIKEPFWRPLDLDFINCRDNKRCKEKEPETSNTYNKKNKDGNYKLFSELEAICKPGGGAGSSSGAANNQTRSGSALTGDENPLMTAPDPAIEQQVAAEADQHESDTSTGGAEAPSKLPTTSSGKRKRKRRHQQQLTSIAAFFESLVKQLMEHQESLHRKFMEVMERRDQERTAREEAWRKQDAAKANREAAARAEERALAATREAAIIAFLEKITGESLNLPTKSQFLQTDHIDQDTNADNNLVVNPMDSSDAFDNDNININTNANSELNGSRALLQLNTSRWPRAEVQALIRVRGGLEPRFQEPGLKGPLWEEVSTRMASIGYHRSSKRCKEKWENINKYFRKTKDSGKKRPQHSKTCPYFHQLDQLYSSKLALPSSTSAPADRRDNSELLDAIVVSTEPASTFKFPEPAMMDYNGNESGNDYQTGNTMATKANNDEDDDNDEEDGADEEDRQENEGEGDSQVQWQEQQQFQSLHT